MSPSEKERHKYHKELSKYIFETTYWEPGYGIKLLNKQAAEKLWKKYTSKESKCQPSSHNQVHHIFSTEHVHIIVYALSMHWAQAWLICDRKSGEAIYGIGWPYNDNYLETMRNISELKNEDGAELDQSQCYDAPYTEPRFVRYHKDGPLMIRVLAKGCTYGEETHEVVLYLDENRVKPLPGSVVVELNTHNATRYGYFLRRENRTKKAWNKNGELTWSEKNHVSIIGLGNDTEHAYIDVCNSEKDQHLYNCKGGRLQRPIIEKECVFEQDAMRVTCKKKVIKRVKLKSFLVIGDSWRTCDGMSNAEVKPCHIEHKKDLLSKVDLFKELGYDISDDTIRELEKEIESLEQP